MNIRNRPALVTLTTSAATLWQLCTISNLPRGACFRTSSLVSVTLAQQQLFTASKAIHRDIPRHPKSVHRYSLCPHGQESRPYFDGCSCKVLSMDAKCALAAGKKIAAANLHSVATTLLLHLYTREVGSVAATTPTV